VIAAAALALALFRAPSDAMAPTLSADLDGDGNADTATAEARHGAVHLRVRGGVGEKTLSATAPSPASDVVRVTLTAATLGSVGSLLEVVAATDTSECLSVWRFHGGALTRIPIRGAGGAAVADCAPAGEWKHLWERASGDAPSVLVRERTTKVERGKLRRRETYAFAGFSLDLDRNRSSTDIDGLPIPEWYDSWFYTRAGLDQLYARFDLEAFRALPQLHVVVDRERGIFALRFLTASEDILAPVESFSALSPEHTAALVAKAGGKTVRAQVKLGGDGSVPIEVRVDGMRPELDTEYAPAGSWHGQVREVFPSAADELAAQHLTGVWSAGGTSVRIQFDGTPPYRLRLDKSLFTLDYDHPAKAADLTLLPTDGSHRGWALVLTGPNALERFPLACDGEAAGAACRADGPVERLRRMGARINVN